MGKSKETPNPETLRKFAIEQSEKMREAMIARGISEKAINESISEFMKSIEQTIKNEENERN